MTGVIILQNVTAISPNLSTSFTGSNGTAPYNYAVLADGAGGTISSSGVYTSPARFGIDTIKVNDSMGLYSFAQILVGSPLELVCDIIQNQMGLTRGQVYLWNQKINLPNDGKLYVAVGVLSCRPFSNVNDMSDGTTQVQWTSFASTISLDIMSRSAQARDRKEEMVMAFNSQYAEQQMELNSFRLFPITNSFVNLSQLDGAAIPYRFQISATIQYFVSKHSPLNYYSSFDESPVISGNT